MYKTHNIKMRTKRHLTSIDSSAQNVIDKHEHKKCSTLDQNNHRN